MSKIYTISCYTKKELEDKIKEAVEDRGHILISKTDKANEDLRMRSRFYARMKMP